MVPNADDNLTGKRSPSDRLLITPQTQLVEELADLRNREGASLARISKKTTLLYFGKLWRQAGRSSADDDPLAAKELLRVSLDEVYDRYKDLLLAQFGFTHHQSSRQLRDTAYLEDLGRLGTAPSKPTLKRWSNRGIDELADRIVSRATASRESMAASDFAGGDPPDRSDTFAIESCTIWCRFRGRVMRDYLSERRIRSRVKGEHFFRVHPIYFSDPREGAVRIEPGYGCELAEPTSFEKGTTFGKLRITKALSAGEIFTFQYRVIVDSDRDSDPLFAHTPESDEAQFSLHLEFDRDAVPANFWTFSNLHVYMSQNRDSRRQIAKRHDGSRYVQESWQGLQKNLSYGIDWEWPIDES